MYVLESECKLYDICLAKINNYPYEDNQPKLYPSKVKMLNYL